MEIPPLAKLSPLNQAIFKEPITALGAKSVCLDGHLGGRLKSAPPSKEDIDDIGASAIPIMDKYNSLLTVFSDIERLVDARVSGGKHGIMSAYRQALQGAGLINDMILDGSATPDAITNYQAAMTIALGDSPMTDKVALELVKAGKGYRPPSTGRGPVL